MRLSSPSRLSGKAWTGCSRVWPLAALAFFAVISSRRMGGALDPLLAAGEQALVGSYQLDHVLLAPGKLVMLPGGSPLFQGMGDTPEQAVKKGLVTAGQMAVLQKGACAMTFHADHHLSITNLPSSALTKTFSVAGVWSMQVYHVFDTYGYRIMLKCDGHEGAALHASFFNADKPDPPTLNIFYSDGKRDGITFRFAKRDGAAVVSESQRQALSQLPGLSRPAGGPSFHVPPSKDLSSPGLAGSDAGSGEKAEPSARSASGRQ